MSTEPLLTDLTDYIERAGVRIIRRDMPPDTPAEFDGLSITLNPAHEPEALAYYLAHSFGSIVGWSLDRDGVTAVFDELREAKCDRDAHPDRFERRLSRFRSFEIASSEYAVAVLDAIGHREAIEPYTVFFRADVEAITLLHRCGRAPVWDAFYTQWQKDVASGARHIEPFTPRQVPAFTPAQTEVQQVKQEIRRRPPRSG